MEGFKWKWICSSRDKYFKSTKLQTGVLNNFDVIEFDGEDTFSAGLLDE